MLDTLPTLAQAQAQSSATLPQSSSSMTNQQHLVKFLSTLTPLCSSHPTLFEPHLPALLSFLPALILPSADCGPTPTVGRPFPSASTSGGSAAGGGGPAFVFPPPGTSPSPGANGGGNGGEDDDEEKQALRLNALEFMISLSEARPSMVRKVNGWVEVVVRACLEGMGEFDEDDAESLETWLKSDVRCSFHFARVCSFRTSVHLMYDFLLRLR